MLTDRAISQYKDNLWFFLILSCESKKITQNNLFNFIFYKSEDLHSTQIILNDLNKDEEKNNKIKFKFVVSIFSSTTSDNVNNL